MDKVRVAPLVGIAGCVGVLAALAYPYAVGATGVSAYYGSGPVNPLVAGLLAAVGVIVFAAGRAGRTDPGFAAGAGLVFGIFMLVILLAWGTTARIDAVQLPQWHRWATLAMAALVPLGGLWFARTLDLL
ncbi:hypothetical protein BRD09_02785 [Halobacteriales archaeon SW_10_68_16]|jgi:hypothetical protein|nr:MAG: hypothetical protein BRD09_02785 [Halobacteriales archaeon SW_10_68_16]